MWKNRKTGWLILFAGFLFIGQIPVRCQAQNACEKRCAKKPDPEDCRKKICRGGGKNAEEKQTSGLNIHDNSGHLGELGTLDNPSVLSQELLNSLSPQELEDWRKKYSQREFDWDKKCIKARPDDPYYNDIEQKCSAGKANISAKLKQIEGQQAQNRLDA